MTSDDRVILYDGAIDIRCGRWQDVLQDVTACDALICDPPYSARTHEGHNNDQVTQSITGQRVRQSVAYDEFHVDDVHKLVNLWSDRTRGWMACMTSHDLAMIFLDAYDRNERYGFAPVPIIQKRPRLIGDGPSSWAVYMMVARPSTREFSTWGCLPGAYEAPTDKTGIVAGAKPLGLMRAIVRDYTRPGDLVVDPFCGGGTTALACAMEGRRCITSEMDPATYAKAVDRLSKGVQVGIFDSVTTTKTEQMEIP